MEGVGSGGSEERAIFLVTGPSSSSKDRELDGRVLELVRTRSSDFILGAENCCLDD